VIHTKSRMLLNTEIEGERGGILYYSGAYYIIATAVAMQTNRHAYCRMLVHHMCTHLAGTRDMIVAVNILFGFMAGEPSATLQCCSF
jgi:hypothetical protein